MADDFKTARPLEYYRKYLEKDVRPDGRNLEEFRPTILNIGCVTTAEGSALLKLGNTTVMCGIKAEIASPKTEEPKKGFIVPNVELSPMCSSRFRPGPPGEQAQVLSQFVNEVIDNSKCVDKEELCIVPGKYVWVLYCDLLCLDYDGNLTDACVLALLAAFRNTVLPKAVFDEETEKLETDFTQKTSLHIHTQPVSSTFAVFDDQILFVDPTVEEEDLATGVITIVTAKDNICIIRKPGPSFIGPVMVQQQSQAFSGDDFPCVALILGLCYYLRTSKQGGSPLSPAQLSDCIDRAFTRSIEVVRLIDETLNSVER